jgi:succinate dehydrogenase/fumarate reductase cytochrome b subunit
MGLKRNVSLKDALRYQGKGPMLTYILHRIGGLGIATFVGLHILASFVGGDFGTFVNTIYEHWAFQIFIYFCVLYHTLHGLRVTLLDLAPRYLKYQREATWLQWMIFVPVYALTIFIMVRNALAGG